MLSLYENYSETKSLDNTIKIILTNNSFQDNRIYFE